MKTIISLVVFVFVFHSADLFAQTATDLNCTSCVQTAEIQNSAVTSGLIRNSAVTTAKISDGTITNADISSTAAIDASKISGTAWTSTNDGSGSSLEADLLDGIDGSQLLRSDESGTITGDLTATGNPSGTGVCIGADCRSVWPAEGEENPWEDGGDGTISYSGGKVGIGTTSPASILDLGSGGTGRRFHVYNAGGANIDGLGIDLGGNSYEYDAFFAYGTSDNGRFVIGSHDGTTFREKVTVLGNGNVGIGTSSPEEKLDVHGTILMNGWDAVLHSQDTSGRYHDLIGTYEGWNPETIYIAGYNATNSPGSRSTKYVSAGPLWIDLPSSNVGIGTSSPSYKLDISGGTGTAMRIAGGGDLQIDAQVSGSASTFYNDYGTLNLSTGLNVEGTQKARELIITEGDLSADFVFKDNYQLKSLAEVESFIQQNKHLPDIPSESEVLANGVSVGDMQKRLLQKVEELTLYVIAQDKKMIEQDKKIAELEGGEGGEHE